MEKIEQLLEAYQEADLQKRLHMYLSYPELRREFIEIDRNEISSAHKAEALYNTPDRGRTASFAARVRRRLCPCFS